MQFDRSRGKTLLGVPVWSSLEARIVSQERCEFVNYALTACELTPDGGRHLCYVGRLVIIV